MADLPDPDQRVALADSAKEAEIARERDDLLHALSAARLDTVQERVAWILNHFPDARDSDIALQIHYWETFEPDRGGGASIRKADLFTLTRLGSLTRARAKIQNTYQLFQASPEVRKYRGKLSDEELEKAVEQRPGYPQFVVYADESGKTAKYLLVGSLWFLHAPQILPFIRELTDFKASLPYEREFHFKEISGGNLGAYRALAAWLADKTAVVSFKAVSVERAGLKSVPEALEILFYHLLVRGVEHEHATARAPLPRGIQLWKDLEEIGSDKVFLAELADRLRTASTTQFAGQLEIGEFVPVESEKQLLVQVADLYTGCLNRILNSEGGKDGPKDQFARHFLQLLGLPDGPQDQETEGGLALHVSL
jgi:uncharacterized protein DUF3800